MAHSPETREKIRQALLGKKHPPERTAKRKGQKRTAEQRKRISEACKGHTPWNKGKKMGNKYPNSGQFKKGQRMSEETRTKIRDSHRKKLKELNPDYIPGASHATARNQRILRNGGYHSKEQWEKLKVRHKWMCAFCKRQEPEISLTKDHIVPLLLGGTDNIGNVQPLCRSCNSKKGHKTNWKSRELRESPERIILSQAKG